MRLCLLLVLLLAADGEAASASDLRQALQMLDYVRVDYPTSVREGAIIDAAEYAEMTEFAESIHAVLESSGAGAEGAVQELADRLVQLIEERAASEQVAAAAGELRSELLERFDLVPVPAQVPDSAAAKRLFESRCAVCHGAEGAGDGTAAKGLTPPPTDFSDGDRAVRQSLLALYNTITLGVEGTAMQGYPDLPQADRWALAFHVSRIFATPAQLAAAEAPAVPLDTRAVLTTAPEEWSPGGIEGALWLRIHPEAYLGSVERPLDVSLRLLVEAAEAYDDGRPEVAHTRAIAAYLDGFELVEAGLRNVAPDLVPVIEGAMLELRSRIRERADADSVRAEIVSISALLRRAQARLEEDRLAPGLAYLSALAILLREGLEALLLVGALGALLARTGRRGAMRYLHAGWVSAVFAGVLTWFIADRLIEISGAAREVTEGVTALVAAAVLFYVGFWMHGKLSAARWNAFLKARIESALTRRALWGITFMAFIAVYREMFETVLFYQALWTQVDTSGEFAIAAGVGSAALILAALAWAVLKLGIRLPLRQFFMASAVLMFALAVVFAGKGVVALQEAGHLAQTRVPLPRVELLGLYPNLQGLTLQVVLVAVALVIVLRGARKTPGGA